MADAAFVSLLLQVGATFLLNLAGAGLTASAVLAFGDEGRRFVRLPVRALTVAGLSGELGFLWWQCSVMADVPLTQVAPAIADVLAHSRFGLLWALQAVGLCLCLVGSPNRPSRSRTLLVGALLFIGARAAASHAGTADPWWPALVDAAHLSAALLWAGLVVGTALRPWNVGTVLEAQACKRYVNALSAWATTALVILVGSGVTLGYRTLGGFEALAGSTYGQILLAKVMLVLVAAGLGGLNRWRYLPPLLAGLSTAPPSDEAAMRRFRRVIAIEAIVLLAVLALAAGLASTAPPLAASA